MHEKHTIKTACTNGLPDDKHMMFETCRRHEELNKNVKLKKCPIIPLHYIIFTYQDIEDVNAVSTGKWLLVNN